MLLTNRLFFEQVEAMLAEGHEVQIRICLLYTSDAADD